MINMYQFIPLLMQTLQALFIILTTEYKCLYVYNTENPQYILTGDLHAS